MVAMTSSSPSFLALQSPFAHNRRGFASHRQSPFVGDTPPRSVTSPENNSTALVYPTNRSTNTVVAAIIYLLDPLLCCSYSSLRPSTQTERLSFASRSSFLPWVRSRVLAALPARSCCAPRFGSPRRRLLVEIRLMVFVRIYALVAVERLRHTTRRIGMQTNVPPSSWPRTQGRPAVLPVSGRTAYQTVRTVPPRLSNPNT